MDSIKYCKTIDYLEWVVGRMSVRYELVGVVGKITEPPREIAKYRVEKSVVAQKR